MKVLVTGAAGQLGSQLLRTLEGSGHETIAVTRAGIDFSRPDAVADRVSEYRADWVINCAAYTQVDRAESEAELAFTVNRDSAASLARGVAAAGGRLIHVSTDFVFGGDQSRPYTEDDAAAPLGVYGRSKWEGEQGVQEALPEACILRTGWVYGVHGNNFVKTMLRLAKERDQLRVVDDQFGTPSWTADISRALLTLLETGPTGIWHFSNEGVASWYDFAQAILQEAGRLGFPIRAGHVEPIPTHAYPTPATRPAFSVLDKQKIRAQLAYPIPHWRDSLVAMLKELKACPDCS
jgi:dTDP-4-dehydrorhamnose reductase